MSRRPSVVRRVPRRRVGLTIGGVAVGSSVPQRSATRTLRRSRNIQALSLIFISAVVNTDIFVWMCIYRTTYIYCTVFVCVSMFVCTFCELVFVSASRTVILRLGVWFWKKKIKNDFNLLWKSTYCFRNISFFFYTLLHRLVIFNRLVAVEHHFEHIFHLSVLAENY